MRYNQGGVFDLANDGLGEPGGCMSMACSP